MTKLPATMPEADMVDTVAHWIELVAAMLTTEAARLTLRRFIREMLRQGAIPTMQVIAAAEAGHQDADMALREAAAEYISRREEMPTEIANYVQRALVMPPVTYPPGRNLADTWLRDVGIAVIVQLAVERWRLKATRNRASSKPSACYVVSRALGRHRHNVAERQVERIYGNHERLARRLSASIPPL
jgi:hypothetical protein